MSLSEMRRKNGLSFSPPTPHQLPCNAKTDVTHQVDSMRSCLEGSHDILSTHVNIDFWNSLGGS